MPKNEQESVTLQVVYKSLVLLVCYNQPSIHTGQWALNMSSCSGMIVTIRIIDTTKFIT